MMRRMSIFVDDTPIELEGETLEQVLGSARAHLSPSGCVVVDVVIDGESLDGQQLGAPEQIALQEREVRLYTADPTELAVSTLGQVRQQLGEADQAQQRAAELLQQDQASEALHLVSQALDTWLQTQQAVQHSATLLGLDLDALEVDGQQASTIIQGLADQLHQLKDTINNGDTARLADALAYEWPTTVQLWDRLITTLIERIEPAEQA